MQLRYRKFGQGPEPLLLFHGIGQTGEECFRSYESELGDRCTLYVFDLPFHGVHGLPADPTRWRTGNHPITPDEWQQKLSIFLEENNLTTFSVAGFSLGGRFALQTLQAFFPRIRKAFLIAPDGVKPHFVYRLATEVAPLRNIFRLIMRSPGVICDAIDGLNRLGVIDKDLVKIVHYTLSNSEKAMQVYLSWVNFRNLKASRSLYKEDVEQLNEKVFLFLGRFDQLITKKDIAPLGKLLRPENVIYLPTGHINCPEKAASLLRNLL
jgi:pimeloyl-ACP methyl ester carboxylesterase